MTCRHMISFLDDFLDGELPADEQTRFTAHLKLCPECQKYVEQYKTTIRLTKSVAEADERMPAKLRDAILKSIK